MPIFYKDFDTAFIPQILKEIYIDRVYYRWTVNSKLSTVLDVGANIGLFSMFIHKYADKIYAMEPSKLHLPYLEKNVKGNKLNKVTILPYALSNKDGEATFYYNKNTTMYSLKSKIRDRKETETVKTKTIKTIFEENKLDTIDFMKLDTEGYEREIIMSQEFEDYAPKIKVIVGEFHAWSEFNPTQLLNALNDYGYKTGWLEGQKAQVFYAQR